MYWEREREWEGERESVIVVRENESESLREARLAADVDIVIVAHKNESYSSEIFPRSFIRSTNKMHEIDCTYYLHVFNLAKSPIYKVLPFTNSDKFSMHNK